MATRKIQLLPSLAEASNPVSLPIVPLPNATTVFQFIYIENSTQYSLIIKSRGSRSREVKRRGRSLPRGISSLVTRPSPLEESSCAILTARCTKPPSLATHLMRSGAEAAHVSGRNWVSEHITVFPKYPPSSSYGLPQQCKTEPSFNINFYNSRGLPKNTIFQTKK